MARPRDDQRKDIAARAVETVMSLLDRCDAASITLNSVAAEVGCRAPALYAYFSNKDALLRAAHDEGFRLLLQGKLAVAARSASDPLDRLSQGGHAYLRFAFEHPGLYQLMFAPPPATGLDSNPFATDPAAHCLRALNDAVLACQADGYMPGADAGEMAFVLWSSVHGAASLVLQDRAPLTAGQSPPSAALAVVDALMTFIRSTRRPPARNTHEG